VEGLRHGLVFVLVAPQLFAISRDQQQRVIRAGAEHQHRQDPLTLAVDQQACVARQAVDRRRRELAGQADRHQRDQP
jgi:hypothetical protein